MANMAMSPRRVSTPGSGFLPRSPRIHILSGQLSSHTSLLGPGRLPPIGSPAQHHPPLATPEDRVHARLYRMVSPRVALAAVAAREKVDVSDMGTLTPTPPGAPSAAGSEADVGPLGPALESNPLVALTVLVDGVGPVTLTIELRHDDSPNTCRPVSHTQRSPRRALRLPAPLTHALILYDGGILHAGEGAAGGAVRHRSEPHGRVAGLDRLDSCCEE
jgi:hypothetical protein